MNLVVIKQLMSLRNLKFSINLIYKNIKNVMLIEHFKHKKPLD